MCVVSTPMAGPLGSDRTRAEGLAFRVKECLSPEKQPMPASWICWLQGPVSQGWGSRGLALPCQCTPRLGTVGCAQRLRDESP